MEVCSQSSSSESGSPTKFFWSDSGSVSVGLSSPVSVSTFASDSLSESSDESLVSLLDEEVELSSSLPSDV